MDSDVFVTIDADPMVMSQARPTGHPMLCLPPRTKAPSNAAEHRIPAVVFSDGRFKETLDSLIAVADLERLSP
eukprot:2146771-Pyramimonas_sp.AAC.1